MNSGVILSLNWNIHP